MTTLVVEIDGGSDVDATELSQLTIQLRRQLLGLDLEEVEPPAASAPPGTKADNATIAGVLLVTLAPAMLPAAVQVIRAWLATAQARSARIELGGDTLELTGMSAQDQHLVIASFLERHANDHDQRS